MLVVPEELVLDLAQAVADRRITEDAAHAALRAIAVDDGQPDDASVIDEILRRHGFDR